MTRPRPLKPVALFSQKFIDWLDAVAAAQGRTRRDIIENGVDWF